MDTTELMIDDIVQPDTMLFPVVITAIMNFDDIMVEGDNDEKWIQLSVVEINPIPITSQIIRANGWQEGVRNKIGESIFNYFIQFDNDINSIGRLYYRVIIDKGPHGLCVSIRYMHELQHLLRIMNFGDLANAIKIA